MIFLDIVTKAKILVNSGEVNKYKFCNKNQLAYFVAREIHNRYINDRDETDLLNIIKYSCFGIYGDILLFLTYIINNLNMLKKILGEAIKFTEGWVEFSLDKKEQISYLSSVEVFEFDHPENKDKEEEEKSKLAQEKRLNDENHLDAIDIYDFDKADIDKLTNQLLRAISLLSVIARCIPNFEHLMDNDEIDMFMNTIYSLPNRIFYVWAKKVEEHKHEIIQILKDLKENEYYHQRKKFTTDDISKLIQWDSMTLLLDLMNLSVVNSLKEHTKDYHNSFDYKQVTNYYIQYLLITKEKGDIARFISEAFNLYDSDICMMTKTMILRTVHHILTHSSKISQKQVQVLESKFFPQINRNRNNDLHQKLLFQRKRNKKRKQ